LVENLDTDRVIAAGIKVQSAAGAITNALDLSDAEIVNAVALGGNNITATNFSLDGGTGDITTSGVVNANGGVLATSATTGSVFDTTATTVTMGSAATSYTIGSTTATGNLRGTTINFPNATSITANSAALNTN